MMIKTGMPFRGEGGQLYGMQKIRGFCHFVYRAEAVAGGHYRYPARKTPSSPHTVTMGWPWPRHELQ